MDDDSEVEMDRRTLLAAMGSLPWVLAACSCPTLRQTETAPLPARGRTPLAPVRVAEKDIPLAFDVHVHLFNATDVDVEGFLKGPVAHSLPEDLRNLVVAAAPVANAVGRALAPSCKKEMAALTDLLTASASPTSPLEDQGLRNKIRLERKAFREQIVEELLKQLPGTDFANQLNQRDQAYQAERSRVQGISRAPTPPLSEDRDRLFEAINFGAKAQPSPKAAPESMGSLGGNDPRGILQFIGFMVSPRHHNLLSFQEAYSETSGSVSMDACFASLVDFDYWLGCPSPVSSLHDQVRLHEELAVLSGGYMLPLVAYNPWTDIERDNASLKLVEDAVINRGFVGIKVYPPMGFRPIGNAKQIDSPLDFPDGDEVDRKLREFYRWCQQHDVPIMSHVSHSMGRDHAHDDLPAPTAWNQLFDELPGLKVNAAHFGGAHGFANRSWSAQLVEIMKIPKGRGLYGDIGYRDGLLNPDSGTFEYFRALLSNNPHAHERVMYGTDWHMIAQLRQWPDYEERIDAFLDKVTSMDPKAFRENVYFKNAARFFGLTTGRPNRLRLEAFYRRRNVPIPAWMKGVA